MSLKGWRIDVTDYEVDGKLFEVQRSIPHALCHHSLNLSGAELLDRLSLATRLREANGDTVELTDDEYQKLKDAAHKMRPVNLSMGEFLLRIENAEQIELAAKDKESG